MPRSRASGCAIWRVWAAAAPLRPAEPASTGPALRHVEPPPRPPASPESRRGAPERPARAPEPAISWHQPPTLVVFHAAGCHLCERALAQLEALREELGFELETVDVGGDPELERRYREWLPVVELDGERLFTYHVHEQALRRRLAATNSLET